MGKRTFVIGPLLLSSLALASAAVAQPRLLNDAECQGLRRAVAGHAALSDGVRRLLVRATAVSGADVSRAMHAQDEMDLDREKAHVEKELTARVRCQDMTAMHDSAIKVRQRELGAREGQVGAIPLQALNGPGADQIARELSSQFASWPAAASQIGLLDQDGDGRLDGFVDVPVEGIFRLYRHGSDGALTVQTFVTAASSQGYSETMRRLDETAGRQTKLDITDLLGRRPAGPVRVVGETAAFSQALSAYLTGNFGDASRRDGAAQTREFHNLRGETVRVMDVIAPLSGGLSVRRLIVLPKPNDQELWEETTTHVTTPSSFQADVETTITRETRTVTGAVIGTRSTAAPIRFRLDR